MTEPFLKWPGGKRWLASRHAGLLPPCYNNYVEPFLGSGAVFFRVAPPSALLADSNEELINAYRCIKSDYQVLEDELFRMQEKHSEKFYYRMRSEDPAERIQRAARFIYLNRTCFNGMYRVNREGKFNVPIGTKTAVAFGVGYLKTIAEILKNVTLKHLDFEKTLELAQPGDFAFIGSAIHSHA